MKHCWMFILGVILSAKLCAQNYSNEVTLVSQDDNSVTVRATAADEKKKEAAILATKSAFHTLFHSGVPGVKNGVSMMSDIPNLQKEQNAYDYRFFTELRYLNYISGEVQTVDSEKFAGMQRVTVQVTIKTKALCADLEHNQMALNPGWSDAKAVNAVAALNPTIVIVPAMSAADGYSFESMRAKLESLPVMRFVIDALAKGFQQNGYKTRDFISQLQNSQVSSVLRADAQTDAATMIIQQLPGDIVVSVEVTVNTDAQDNGECMLNLRAVEKQTNGQLATETFASGQYMRSNPTELAGHALKKIQTDFFKQLQSSFEAMIKKGREVFIEMNLSQTVTEWDFDQDAPATGDYFKDALDEWLREHAFQGVYDMSNSTDKFINIRLNIPLWNMERNRSYTLSNFGSDMRKFFKAQLGDEYKASTTAMGQKLMVVIE